MARPPVQPATCRRFSLSLDTSSYGRKNGIDSSADRGRTRRTPRALFDTQKIHKGGFTDGRFATPLVKQSLQRLQELEFDRRKKDRRVLEVVVVSVRWCLGTKL